MNQFVGISAGGNHTSALTTSGVVYTWGRNENSQLGMNDTNPADRYDVPREVLGDADSEFKYNVAKISAGDEHTAALSQNGNVWTWGYNYYGRLGDGSGETRAMPGKVVTALNYGNISILKWNCRYRRRNYSHHWQSRRRFNLRMGRLICTVNLATVQKHRSQRLSKL